MPPKHEIQTGILFKLAFSVPFGVPFGGTLGGAKMQLNYHPGGLANSPLLKQTMAEYCGNGYLQPLWLQPNGYLQPASVAIKRSLKGD